MFLHVCTSGTFDNIYLSHFADTILEAMVCKEQHNYKLNVLSDCITWFRVFPVLYNHNKKLYIRLLLYNVGRYIIPCKRCIAKWSKTIDVKSPCLHVFRLLLFSCDKNTSNIHCHFYKQLSNSSKTMVF